MRRLIIIALVLLTIPSLVVWRQYCATYRDEGSRANYLEIEEPGKIDLDPAKFRAGGVPILCYHYLRGPAGPVYLLRVLGAVLFNLPTLREREYWTTPADLFVRHMEWLLENGYTTIDLDELEEILAGKKVGPAKPIVITFDDGDTSILRYAYPFLARHGMKATIMVVTSKVGQSWKDVNTLNWAQLGMLEKSGVFKVESHSDDMHYKVKGPHGKMQPVFLHEVPYEGPPLPNGELFVSLDLRRSSQSLRKHLGHGARWLAWPYGWASSPLDSLAAREGYQGSLSLAAGTNEPGRDSTWHLARITVTARTTLRSFQQLMRAAEREAPSIARTRSGATTPPATAGATP